LKASEVERTTKSLETRLINRATERKTANNQEFRKTNIIGLPGFAIFRPKNIANIGLAKLKKESKGNKLDTTIPLTRATTRPKHKVKAGTKLNSLTAYLEKTNAKGTVIVVKAIGAGKESTSIGINPKIKVHPRIRLI